MAALAEEGAATGRQPALVRRGMRSRVALLSDETQNGAAPRREQPARLLDRRRIHPVLGVAEAHARRAAGVDQLVGRRKGCPEHLGTRRRRITEEPGERLLDDDVLPRPRGVERERGVDGVRDAEIQDVDLGVVQDPLDVAGHGSHAELLGERARPLRPAPRHPSQVDVDPSDVPVGLGVDTGHKPGPHQAYMNSRPVLRHSLPLSHRRALIRRSRSSTRSRGRGRHAGRSARSRGTRRSRGT